jgi:hypothetical protein
MLHLQDSSTPHSWRCPSTHRTLTQLNIPQDHDSQHQRYPRNKSRIKRGKTLKYQFHPRTGHKGPDGVYRHSSTLSLTWTLYRDEWSTPGPSRCTPGQRNGAHSTRSWVGRTAGQESCRKFCPPPGIDQWTVQLVASRYTNYAIPILHWITV